MSKKTRKSRLEIGLLGILTLGLAVAAGAQPPDLPDPDYEFAGNVAITSTTGYTLYGEMPDRRSG